MDQARQSETDRARSLEARWLNDFAALVALDAAQRAGLIDRLCDEGVPEPAGEDASGGEALLLRLLEMAGAAERQGALWRPSPDLARLRAERWPGFVARLRFTAMAAADLLRGSAAYFGDLPAFMARSGTFGFFNYGRAQGTGAANLQDTEPWCAYVTALSEDEAPALAPLLPLEGVERLLEIGGNTGAFALGVLDRWPGLRIAVLDLPAVTALGRRHAAGRPGADRLEHVPGDMRADPLPLVEGERPDAILFKSVLHDWPEEQAAAMIARAAAHLAPGGRVVICERGAFADEQDAGGLAGAANLVFSRFYRPPERYEHALASAGLRVLGRREARLDMRFWICAGERA